jgi:hypothetical protein
MWVSNPVIAALERHRGDGQFERDAGDTADHRPVEERLGDIGIERPHRLVDPPTKALGSYVSAE